MNADQIKRQRHVRRSKSSETEIVRLAQVPQRHPPLRSKSSELPVEFGQNRVIQTRPELEREVSGLGMEDPAMAPCQRRNSRGLKLGGELFNEEDDEVTEISIASDPTANEENEGLDIAMFHASLSMGDSSGFLSQGGCSTNCSGRLDDQDSEHLIRCSTHHSVKSSIANSPTTSSVQHIKPDLIFPPRMVDLQASMESLNVDEALEICKRLDAQEIEQFNEHQKHASRLRRLGNRPVVSPVLPNHRRRSLSTSAKSSSQPSPDSSSHKSDFQQSAVDATSIQNHPSPDKILRRKLNSGSNSVDTVLPLPSSLQASHGFSPRRSSRTVRKLRVVGRNMNSINLEDVATACSAIQPRG
jgi:hypothetical protein